MKYMHNPADIVVVVVVVMMMMMVMIEPVKFYLNRGWGFHFRDNSNLIL